MRPLQKWDRLITHKLFYCIGAGVVLFAVSAAILIMRTQKLSSFLISSSGDVNCRIVCDRGAESTDLTLSSGQAALLVNSIQDTTICYAGQCSYFYAEEGEPLYRLFFWDNDNAGTSMTVSGRFLYIGMSRYKIAHDDIPRIHRAISACFL